MALKVMVAPLRYVQGPNALAELGGQLQAIDIRKPLIVASPSAKRAVGDTVSSGLDAAGIEHAFADFGGECTRREIERIKTVCLEAGHDAIVNCGGGKVLDAGRAAACASAFHVEAGQPVPDLGAAVACINVPTVAATDAATSSVSLVYNDHHVVEATMVFPANPTMVFVDTSVIAKAPVRLLVAGMGDALATHFEAAMSHQTGTPCILTQSQSTHTARVLARLCLDLLLEYGVQAKGEAEVGIPGPALEAVTEANVLLSGLGFESGGLSGAHAVGLAFNHIPQAFSVPQYHGEMVAFGTLTQLLLEDRRPDELDRIFGFCRRVGLPTTFEELTLRDVSDEVLETVALAASRDIIVRSMPRASMEPDENGCFYDPADILTAMKATDAYGRAFAARQ